MQVPPRANLPIEAAWACADDLPVAVQPTLTLNLPTFMLVRRGSI